MFFDKLSDLLSQQGFEKVMLDRQGIFGYVREESGVKSCVMLINLPDQLPEDITGICYSLEQIKQQISGGQYTRFLFVYLTNQPEAVKVLCEQTADIHWIIDREQLRLIIYENQPDEFCGLRSVIEDALIPVKQKTKRFSSYMTVGIIGLNVIIFIIMYLFCSDGQRQALIDAGGLYWPAVLIGHEVWRVLTSMFIHSGINHLLNNMLLLFFIGTYVEEYIGHRKFIFLYFASGILAGAVSMGYNIFNEKLILSIGASGAIYGVVGALAAFIILSRGMIRDITAPRLVVFIGLSILGGLQTEGVDNMAHIGGLMSGFILAAVFVVVSKVKNRNVIQVRKVDN